MLFIRIVFILVSMVLFDNIVFALQKSGGISVVWHEILKRFVRDYPNDVRFMDYGTCNNICRSRMNIDPAKIIADDSASFLVLKRFFPVRIATVFSSRFIFHSSYYRYCTDPNAINITTVHDFTYEYFVHGWKKWLHCWQKYRAIRHSDYIICISENTKKDLLKFLPDIEEKKVHVIYNGVSDDYFPIEQPVTLTSLPFPADSYVLFVGGRDAYKNFRYAVEVVARTNFNLLIVGNPLTQQEDLWLKTYLPVGRYTCVGRVDNQQLNVLYNKAFCLFYPSAYEGFGIPVIEAQKAGCPVIAYEASSIPEIIGQGQLLLPDLDVSLGAQYLNKLKNFSFRTEIVERGFVNAKRFSWEKTYQETLNIYKSAQQNGK